MDVVRPALLVLGTVDLDQIVGDGRVHRVETGAFAQVVLKLVESGNQGVGPSSGFDSSVSMGDGDSGVIDLRQRTTGNRDDGAQNFFGFARLAQTTFHGVQSLD